MVSLSNIKRLFRLRYKTELSETYFGHSRLSDLLQDEKFSDLCTLRLQKNGYIVVPKGPLFHVAENSAQHADTTATWPPPSWFSQPLCRSSAAVISLEDSLQLGNGSRSPHVRSGLGRRMVHGFEQESTSGSSDAELPVVHFCPDEPLCLEDVAHVREVSSSPTGALPTPLPSPGVPPSATIRKWSFYLEASPGDPSYVVTDAQRSEGPSPVQPSSLAPCRVELCGYEHRCLDDALEVPHCPAPLSSPTPLPSPGLPADAMMPSWLQGPCRIEFCKDEPLRLEDGGWSPWRSTRTPLASPGVPESATILKWAGLAHKHDLYQDQPCNQESSGGQPLVEAVSPALKWPTQWRSLASLKNSGPGGKLVGSSGASPPAHKGLTSLPPTHSQTLTTEENGDSVGMLTPRVEPPNARTRMRRVPEPLTAEAMYSPAVEGWAAAGLVHNTFIHARPPLPTPVARRRRSQSLPKDVMLGQSNAEALPNGGTEDHEQLQSKDGPNSRCQTGCSDLQDEWPSGNMAIGLLNSPVVLAAQEHQFCPLMGSDLQASPMPGERRSQSVPAGMHEGASLLSGEMDGLKVQSRATRRSSTLRLGAGFQAPWQCRALGA